MKQHFPAPGLLYVFLQTFSFAQAQNEALYSVGINAGTFIYQGDLTPWTSGSLKTPRFVLGLTGARKLTSTLSARLELNFGSLRGDETKYPIPEYRQERAFAFKSRTTEVIAAAVYHPLPAHRLSPYVYGGVGYSFLKITRDYSRFNAEYFSGEPELIQNLQADISHPLPGGTWIAPVGAGVQYTVSQRVAINTEASYRMMSNDYLDGFSKAANPDRGDHYYKYAIGLSFALGIKDKYGCPTLRY